MDHDAVLSRVKEVVCETFGAAPETLSADTTAHDVPGWDSVGHLVFITGIEAAFDVQLPMEESLNVPDLGSLAALVARSKA